MLQDIRDKAQGWIAWVIVILISIPFALWGVNEYFTDGGNVYVAKVDEREISSRELQQAFQVRRQQLQSMLGGGRLPDFLTDDVIKQQALDGLVRETVILQGAMNAGFQASDRQVAQEIMSIPVFQTDGRFDHALYQQRLSLQGYSETYFEDQVRGSLISEQIIAGIQDTAFVTKEAVAQRMALASQERQVATLTLSADRLAEQVSISDEDLAAFHSANSDRYLTPEQVSIEYIELKQSELGSELEATDDELFELYEDQKSEMVSDEERQARHILIAVDAGAAAEEQGAAKAKAMAALDRINSNQDFAQVAREMSDDPGSAELGGDLGWFPRGMMVPEFEDFVFSADVGQVSDLVKTDFGYHIIEVQGTRGGDTQSFEEARPRLLAEYRRQAGEKRFYDLSDQLANLTYEQPDSLVPASETLELKIHSSDMFSASGGPGIASDSRVVTAAFNEDVLKGNNSDILELAPDHLVVLRVKEHQPESVKALSEVREAVEKALFAERVGDLTRKQAESMRAELKTLDDIEAKASEGDYKAASWIQRNTTVVAPSVAKKAFQMGQPADGQVLVDGLAQANGDYVLIAVAGVRGAETEASQAQMGAMTVRMQTMAGDNEWAGLINDLTEKADVHINERAL